MASITDCVVEGLKYPFNNIKNLLSFGVLLALIDMMYLALSMKSVSIARLITHTDNFVSLSQLPSGELGIAALIGVIIFILQLFMMGYQFRVVKFSIGKNDDLPGFDNILGMLVNGVKYFIVALAYNIIPVIIIAASVMLIKDTSLMIVPVAIAAVLSAISFFFLIMALNNMVAHDKLSKAFDFSEIIDNIRSLGWVKYVGTIIFTLIVFMIIMVATGIIMSFLTVIFTNLINNQAIYVSIFIGILEGLFINSYGTVFLNRVFGSVYRESVK